MTALQNINRIIWQTDDTATRALVKPIMEDTFGKHQDMETPEEAKTWQTTYEYLLKMTDYPSGLFTMGDISCYGNGFFDGYLKALEGIKDARSSDKTTPVFAQG